MYAKYVRVVENELKRNPHEWTFKRNADYRRTLEHVSYDQGLSYLKVVNEKFGSFFGQNHEIIKNCINLNDSIGKPLQREFQHSGLDPCSPTNLRYLLHSLLILSHIKDLGMHCAKVVEIGGGYGGLCLFLHHLAPLFEIRLDSYVIFDLPAVAQLQKAVLNTLGITEVKTLSETTNAGEHLSGDSFLISNYAFSEISSPLRAQYENDVIKPYVSHGFLTWNFIPVYNFVDVAISVEREHPSTSPKNFYVRF